MFQMKYTSSRHGLLVWKRSLVHWVVLVPRTKHFNNTIFYSILTDTYFYSVTSYIKESGPQCCFQLTYFRSRCLFISENDILKRYSLDVGGRGELSNWDLWFSDAVAWIYLGIVLVMILVYNTDGKTEGRFHFFPFLTAVSYIFKRVYENTHFFMSSLCPIFQGVSAQYSLKTRSI